MQFYIYAAFLMFASSCRCSEDFWARVMHYDEYTLDELSLVPAFTSDSSFRVICKCKKCKSISLTHPLNYSFEFKTNYTHYEWWRIGKDAAEITGEQTSTGLYSCVFDESTNLPFEITYEQCTYTKDNANCNYAVCITDETNIGCQTLTKKMCQLTHKTSSTAAGTVICSKTGTYLSLCEALISYVFEKSGDPPLYEVTGDAPSCDSNTIMLKYFSIFIEKNGGDCNGDLVEAPIGSTFHLTNATMTLCYLIPHAINATFCHGTMCEHSLFCKDSPSCMFNLTRKLEDGDSDKYTYKTVMQGKTFFSYVYVIYVGNPKLEVKLISECPNRVVSFPNLKCNLKFSSDKLKDQVSVLFSWYKSNALFIEESPNSFANVSEGGDYSCIAFIKTNGYSLYKDKIENTKTTRSRTYHFDPICENTDDNLLKIGGEEFHDEEETDSVKYIIVGVVIGLIILVIISAIIFLVVYRRRTKQKSKQISSPKQSSLKQGFSQGQRSSLKKDSSQKQRSLKQGSSQKQSES